MLRDDVDICAFSDTVEDVVKNYVILYTYIMFILVEVILCPFLMRTLKQNLNFYYTKSKCTVIALTVLSLAYFTFKALLFLDWKYFKFDANIIALKDEFPINYSTVDIVVCMLVNILFNIPLFLYAYLNIKGINFKLYLSAIMQGYCISSHLHSASLFVKLRKDTFSKPNSEKSDADSEGSYFTFVDEDAYKEEDKVCEFLTFGLFKKDLVLTYIQTYFWVVN